MVHHLPTFVPGPTTRPQGPPRSPAWVYKFNFHTQPSMVSINNISKYHIFFRPDEAMLFVMVKACLHSNYFLFLRVNKDFVLSFNESKQNEKPSLTKTLHIHISY